MSNFSLIKTVNKIIGLRLIGVFLAATCLAAQCTPPPAGPVPSGHLKWLSKKQNNADEMQARVQADQYYRTIGAITTDSNGNERRETLDDFKNRNGFNVADGNEVVASYFNEADLRFGRKMHCRRRPNQPRILACYVGNYGPAPVILDRNDPNFGQSNPAWPNQTAALDELVNPQHPFNPFATVAMEARVVNEKTLVTVKESDGSPIPPNLVCGTVFDLPTPCDHQDVDTGIDVFPGDTVEIKATGSVQSGIWFDAARDANGIDSSGRSLPAGAGFPLSTVAAFSLIGRLGPTTGFAFSYFFIGTSGTATNTTGSPQRLFLRTNDNVPANGGGQFGVTITYLNRVNFFTYGDDNNLVSAAALDKEGAKATPGICMACHGGNFSGTPVSVVGATYLPFDVQSFRYPNQAGLTLADQQEAMRKLNELVVESKPNETNTHRPIVRFINSLYQSPGGVHGAGNVARDAVTPAGWQGHDAAYQFVSKPYCQMCHMALDESKDFTTFANFESNAVSIENDVCKGTSRSMPHAQVPFEKFWSNTLPKASGALMDELGEKKDASGNVMKAGFKSCDP